MCNILLCYEVSIRDIGPDYRNASHHKGDDEGCNQPRPKEQAPTGHGSDLGWIGNLVFSNMAVLGLVGIRTNIL